MILLDCQALNNNYSIEKVRISKYMARLSLFFKCNPNPSDLNQFNGKREAKDNNKVFKLVIQRQIENSIAKSEKLQKRNCNQL